MGKKRILRAHFRLRIRQYNERRSAERQVNLKHVQKDSVRALVEAAVGGDIESFGELCRQYYAAMVAVAYAVLGDHQLAEDAAQESFARALVRLKSLRNRARFAPWLAAICRNVAKDMVAAKARPINSEDLRQVTENDHADQSSRAIRRAVEQLPNAAKELIVLRYYNNLSYEQIAPIL
ncbi:MAG: sigma-70 family RNA polymerase sigma factor, partial [Phycisphaerales bacterium]